MNKFWVRILRLGIDKSTDTSSARYITLTNILVVLSSIITLAFVPLWMVLLPQIKAILPIFVLAGFANLLVLALNHNRQFLFGRIFYGLLYLIFFIVLILIFGPDSHIQFIMLVATQIAFFIYPPSEKHYMYAMHALWYSSLAFLMIWQTSHPPFLDQAVEVTSVIGLSSSLGAMALMFGTAFYIHAIINYTEGKLAKEHEKSESLLLNILPKVIARQLKGTKTLIADHQDNVTVLFADIVNFTQSVKNLHPDDLIAMLDEIFGEFDLIVGRHQVEKIKTIGDEYMAAAGVPEAREDHCELVAEVALEMMAAMKDVFSHKYKELDLRIGIHTGPVVAGVIGRKKFIYDLWGDTVNIASRMESHGLKGKIQVTREVRERLRSGYLFEYRGEIDIKGKGMMPAYFLTGRSTEEPGREH